jgi:hypothetical protein
MRYSNHVKTFLGYYGQGPWDCAYCGKLITQCGRGRGLGVVHHIDENKLNNDPLNLAIMHFECHRRHHMIGVPMKDNVREKIRNASIGHSVSSETRAKIGDANRGNTYCVGRVASRETRKKLANMGTKITCTCGLSTYRGSMVSHIRASGHVVIDGQ